MAATVAVGLDPPAEAGTGEGATRSSHTAAEEGRGADQPEAGRGGIGGGLDAAAAQGSEVSEGLVSAHPDTEVDAAPQPKSALLAEAEVAVWAQSNDSGRAACAGRASAPPSCFRRVSCEG